MASTRKRGAKDARPTAVVAEGAEGSLRTAWPMPSLALTDDTADAVPLFAARPWLFDTPNLPQNPSASPSLTHGSGAAPILPPSARSPPPRPLPRPEFRVTLARSTALLLAAAVAGFGRPRPSGPTSPGRPFGEVTKGSEVGTGIFTIYFKHDSIYLSLAPRQLDRDYLLVTQISQGIGELGLDGGASMRSDLVRFHREGDRVELWVVNSARGRRARHADGAHRGLFVRALGRPVVPDRRRAGQQRDPGQRRPVLPLRLGRRRHACSRRRSRSGS